jgi:hypothetical protein
VAPGSIPSDRTRSNRTGADPLEASPQAQGTHHAIYAVVLMVFDLPGALECNEASGKHSNSMHLVSCACIH